MKQTLLSIPLIFVLVALCSCRGGNTSSASDGGDTIRLKYAERITMVKHDGYTVVTLADPWNTGRTLHTYVLVPSDKDVPGDLPKGTVIRTPLKRTVIATSVHCGLVMSFGRGGSIGGVCDLQYINLPWIAEQCRKGKIANCGSGLSPTIEKIIDLQPDAVFLSPFQNSGGYGRMDELDIPIVEAADYMETSAMGRAEWMKFYGMLFGAEHEADSIFNAVESNYMKLKELAKTSSVSRSVLMDKQTGAVWYVPGGSSTIGRLISDANARYPWSADKSSGSLALPFESVLEKGGDSDVWMFRYNSNMPATRKTLLTENKGYSQFKSFQTGEVYGCNTAVNTFYEDTPFHPDLLLRDFIIITHPDIKGLGELKYFMKVEDF